MTETAQLQITWTDGTVSLLDYERLRAACRCARCRVRQAPLSGPPAGLSDVGLFGDYALRLFFADGHDTGLYPFSYLRELAAHSGDGL